MKRGGSVLQFRARLSELESKLRSVGYITNEAEQLRALLRGLLEEYTVTAEVIRGMEKSLNDVMGLLISKEATLTISEDREVRGTNGRAYQTTSGNQTFRFKC